MLDKESLLVDVKGMGCQPKPDNLDHRGAREVKSILGKVVPDSCPPNVNTGLGMARTSGPGLVPHWPHIHTQTPASVHKRLLEKSKRLTVSEGTCMPSGLWRTCRKEIVYRPLYFPCKSPVLFGVLNWPLEILSSP